METINLDNINRIHTEGHSSKGDQPKWKIGEKWYKADYMGYEALSEILISSLLEKSNIANYVKYQPVMLRSNNDLIPGCECLNFRGSNEQLITIERLHRAYNGTSLAKVLGTMQNVSDRISYSVEFIEKTTNLIGVGKYITSLLELDAFFLNEDRHTNNIAVIRNEETKEFRFSPIFDNGLCLLSDTHDYPEHSDIYSCIDRVNAKPFSTHFNEQVEAAEYLYGSPIHFHFNRRDVRASIELLNDAYPAELLQRVERIIYEQMRKYPVFF